MIDDAGFAKDLEKTINNADEKVDKRELLEDIFKSYVAKLFEVNIQERRLPYGVLIEVKRLLIAAFRSASLSEYQRSVKQYEELFDKTVQEIIDYASTRNNEGEDIIEEDKGKVLEINAKEYQNQSNFKKNDSGLFIPK